MEVAEDPLEEELVVQEEQVELLLAEHIMIQVEMEQLAVIILEEAVDYQPLLINLLNQLLVMEAAEVNLHLLLVLVTVLVVVAEEVRTQEAQAQVEQYLF
jgi:hypothetical protein